MIATRTSLPGVLVVLTACGALAAGCRPDWDDIAHTIEHHPPEPPTSPPKLVCQVGPWPYQPTQLPARATDGGVCTDLVAPSGAIPTRSVVGPCPEGNGCGGTLIDGTWLETRVTYCQTSQTDTGTSPRPIRLRISRNGTFFEWAQDGHDASGGLATEGTKLVMVGDLCGRDPMSVREYGYSLAGEILTLHNGLYVMTFQREN
jgi:hypothetical protein